jgi:hypothetical protein
MGRICTSGIIQMTAHAVLATPHRRTSRWMYRGEGAPAGDDRDLTTDFRERMLSS